jgi:uncharacterized protein YjbI with pentapeptide repeats
MELREMKIDKPRITGDLQERKFEEVFYEESNLLEDALITGASLDGEVGKLRLYNCVVKNSRFTNCDFSGFDLTDVRFENCDFSNSDLGGASIHRVEFLGCKFVGTNFPDSSFGNVEFYESSVNLASFADSKFKKVCFNRSYAKGTYFYNCRFAGSVDFTGCDLDEANFTESSLKKIDISSCTFKSLTLSLFELKGCKVSPEQALHIIETLGVIVA